MTNLSCIKYEPHEHINFRRCKTFSQQNRKKKPLKQIVYLEIYNLNELNKSIFIPFYLHL